MRFESHIPEVKWTTPNMIATKVKISVAYTHSIGILYACLWIRIVHHGWWWWWKFADLAISDNWLGSILSSILCVLCCFFFSVNVTETPASVVISIAHQCDVRARAHTTDIHILEEKSGSAAYMICRQYVEEIVTHLVSVFCFLHHRTIKKHTQRYLTILLFPVCLCRFVIFPRNTHNHTDRHYSQ